MIKNFLCLVAMVFAVNAFAIDLTALKVSAVQSGLNDADLVKLVSSDKAVCIQIRGKLMLASKGAIPFKNPTRGMGCSESIQRNMIGAGKEVVIVKKSQIAPETYAKFERAYLTTVSAN